MKNWIEIQFWRVAKWIIRRGYGADCPTRDTDDMPELLKTYPNSRCASCRAKETIEFIDDHISLLKG